MDNNSLVIISDPRLGPVEEFNILNPKMRRKKLKSNYIQNNITSIIILISLIFTFLALSDIIPIFDNFQSEYRQTNKNKAHHMQENKESKTKPSSSNSIVPSTQPNLSSDSTELKNKDKDKDINTNSITESSNTNATQSSNGNIGLNQNYEKIDENDSKYTYIPIVGIDDIHGNFFPKVNNIILEDGKSITYKTGGLEYVTKYINILRHDFGSNRVLFFDGGDFYQGGIDSVLFDGEILLDYYNLVGINGSTIGNHEFDYSKAWIEHKIKNSKHKTLINNIMDNTTNSKEGALGKNHETSHLYDIKLDNGDMIKIGVIGLSFNMKNDKKLPNTWGNRDSWDNITFFSYMEGLEEESKKLRDKGASAIILLAHFGLVCNQTEALKLDMYNKSSSQGMCYRDDEDSVLYKLLDNLPNGVIDGIIGGDTHMSMHHWEKNIAMMSTPTHA